MNNHDNCMDFEKTTEFIMSLTSRIEYLENNIRQMIADYDTELEFNDQGVKSIREVIARLEEFFKE